MREEVPLERLTRLAADANGYITSAQATELGIPRRLLASAVKSGALVKIERGLYALPETIEDPLFVAQFRFKRGTFSDESALFLHGLTDRAPFLLTMTFPRSYNASPARSAGIVCRSCASDLLRLGICEVTTEFGNLVRAYDRERTLCDILRGQSIVDTQVVVPAMRAYVASSDRDPMKLVSYARKLGVERKVRSYLEVLL